MTKYSKEQGKRSFTPSLGLALLLNVLPTILFFVNICVQGLKRLMAPSKA